jgi:hypothetical protein
MVIKVRPKKVIFYDKHLQYLRVMKWCVDSMFKSKVYEHNYNWVFLSSDREAKGIFPKFGHHSSKYGTKWKNKQICVSLCFTLLMMINKWMEKIKMNRFCEN